MAPKNETKGIKYDQGKQPWFYMPLCILKPLADVYQAGVVSKGYTPFNCLQPFDDWSRRLYEAQMRHTEASQINPLAINEEDGGVYHLAQVAFSALTRLDNALRELHSKELETELSISKTMPPPVV